MDDSVSVKYFGFGAPGGITRPIPGPRPFGARLRRFKIVPDDFVELTHYNVVGSNIHSDRPDKNPHTKWGFLSGAPGGIRTLASEDNPSTCI